MPTLENDQFVFRFPPIEADADFAIHFQRTLRIPDTETTYSLPPGLGSFPVRHAEDYVASLPPQVLSRGGVVLPMWQAEPVLNDAILKRDGKYWANRGNGAIRTNADYECGSQPLLRHVVERTGVFNAATVARADEIAICGALGLDPSSLSR